MNDSSSSYEAQALDSDNEAYVPVADLLWFCVSKWRVILVLMLVVAVVVNTCAYLSQRAEAALSDQDIVDQFLTTAEDDGTYTEADIEGFDEMALTLATYYKNYQEQTAYNKESKLLGIDWTDVVSMTAYYQVYCGDSSSEADLLTVTDTITARLNSDELYIVAGEALGIDAKYVRELVSAGNSMTVSSDSTPILDSDATTTSSSTQTNEVISIYLQDEPYSAIVYITAKGEDEQFCQTILDCAGDTIDAMVADGDLSQSADDVEVTFLLDQKSSGVDTTIRDIQKNSTSAKVTYESNMETLLQDLGTDESDYVKAKASVIEQELGLLTETETPKVGYISKLYLGVGLIGGFIVGLLFYVLRYIFDDRMQSPVMFEDGVVLREYLVDSPNVAARGIDAFIRAQRYASHKIMEPARVVALISAEISAIKNITVKKVLITSTDYSTQGAHLVAGIKDELVRRGIQVVSLEQFMYDPTTLEEALDADVAVVIEGVGRSKKSNVEDELSYLALHDLPVVAAVIELA